MEVNIKRLLLLLVAAILLAVGSYIPIALICSFLASAGMNIGHAMIVLLALVCGYPVGSILGIVLMDRIVFRANQWNVPGIAISLVLTLSAGYFGFTLLDTVGGSMFFLMPFITAFLSLVGYSIPISPRHKGRSQN